MERNILWLSLFLLFIFERSVVPMIIPTVGNGVFHVQFVFVAVLLIGLHYHRHSALLHSICFGFMHDLLFGQMLGVTAFSMGLTAYLISLIFANKFEVFSRDLLVISLGILFFYSCLLVFYFAFGLFAIEFYWGLLFSELLPSLVVNLIFAALIYFPARKYLHKMSVRYGSYSSGS